MIKKYSASGFLLREEFELENASWPLRLGACIVPVPCELSTKQLQP